MSLTWFLRNVRQVEEGGVRRRTMYCSTVDFANSIPIICSSPTIRGAPQSGLAEDIRRMRSRTSLVIAGLPGLPDRHNLVQYSRNFLLCHAMTVSGLTNTSASRQSDQTRDNQDQKMRS